MNELYHYGILGMKWGVRRYQNPDGSLTALGRARYGSPERLRKSYAKKNAKHVKKTYRKDLKDNTELTRKSIKKMSDEDLKDVKNRLSTEKEVLELNRTVLELSDSKFVQKGKQFVSDVVYDSQKKVFTTALTGAELYALQEAGKKFSNELGVAIFNGGAKKK